MKTKLSLFSIFLLLVSGNILAADLKIATGVAGYNAILKPIEADYQKTTGSKFTFADNIDSTGIVQMMQAVLTGKADFGLSPGNLEDFIVTMTKNGHQASEFKGFAKRVVGHDYLKIVAHKDLKLKPLTKEQLDKIFSGETANWKEVGGPDLKIKIALQTKYAATNDFFKKAAMSPGKNFPDSAQKGESIQEMVKFTAETPGAVCFVSKSFATENVSEIALEKVIGRPFIVYTNGAPNKQTDEFLQFMAKRTKEK